MSANETANPKQLVAAAAAARVTDNMLVGLGTGSTANLFIDALAARQQDGLQVQVAASSVVSANRALDAGLNVIACEHIKRLDLYVDGADEVAPDLTLLKGRGQDLVREKIMATYADEFIVLVDEGKLVENIGEKNAIPIEVYPHAWQLVMNRLGKLGAKGQLRHNPAGDNVAYSAAGNLILDMDFSRLDAHQINALLTVIPGVVEHGVFVDVAARVLVGTEQGVDERTP